MGKSFQVSKLDGERAANLEMLWKWRDIPGGPCLCKMMKGQAHQVFLGRGAGEPGSAQSAAGCGLLAVWIAVNAADAVDAMLWML